MKKLSKPHPGQPNFSWDVDSPALRAKLRMVELPIDINRDQSKQVLFPCKDLWVPVSVVNGNVHILPGVPRLCELHPSHQGVKNGTPLTSVPSHRPSRWPQTVYR